MIIGAHSIDYVIVNSFEKILEKSKKFKCTGLLRICKLLRILKVKFFPTLWSSGYAQAHSIAFGKLAVLFGFFMGLAGLGSACANVHNSFNSFSCLKSFMSTRSADFYYCIKNGHEPLYSCLHKEFLSYMS